MSLLELCKRQQFMYDLLGPRYGWDCSSRYSMPRLSQFVSRMLSPWSWRCRREIMQWSRNRFWVQRRIPLSPMDRESKWTHFKGSGKTEKAICGKSWFWKRCRIVWWIEMVTFCSFYLLQLAVFSFSIGSDRKTYCIFQQEQPNVSPRFFCEDDCRGDWWWECTLRSG